MTIEKIDYEKVKQFVSCNYNIDHLEINEEKDGILISNTLDTSLLTKYKNKHGLEISNSTESKITISVRNKDKFKDWYRVWQEESKLQQEILKKIYTKKRTEPHTTDYSAVYEAAKEVKINIPVDTNKVAQSLFDKEFVEENRDEIGSPIVINIEEKDLDNGIDLPLLDIDEITHREL